MTIIYISIPNIFKLYYDIWYCLSFIDKNKMSICNQLITKSNLFTILFDKTNILWGLHTSKKTFQNIFRRIRVDTKWTSKTSFWTLSSSFNDVGKWDVDPIFLMKMSKNNSVVWYYTITTYTFYAFSSFIWYTRNF